MQGPLNNHPLVFVPFFIALGCAAIFSIALFSGWRKLAERFRLRSSFTGVSWGLQSAYMRWASHYGNCLNVGADSAGLKLSVVFLFRVGHPPLFIPWSEISVVRRSSFLFFRRVRLELGREEQIPFVIGGSLADGLRIAAGASWPIEPTD